MTPRDGAVREAVEDLCDLLETGQRGGGGHSGQSAAELGVRLGAGSEVMWGVRV